MPKPANDIRMSIRGTPPPEAYHDMLKILQDDLRNRYQEKIYAVPELTLQAVFDIAVGSMDFGSGMLDNEEVELLRQVATTLEIDLRWATPDNFWKTYYPDESFWGWRHNTLNETPKPVAP